MGESTARMNVSDLRKMLGLPDVPIDADSLSDVRSADSDDAVSQTRSSNSGSRHFRVRRQSMEQLHLIKVFLLFFISFLCFPIIITKNVIVMLLKREEKCISVTSTKITFPFVANTRRKTNEFATESGNFTR